MYRRLFCFAVASLAAFHLLLSATAQEVQLNGKVTHVTLYRSQAMVTRTLNVEGAAGSLEIVVADLPENVITDSLFAEGGDQIEVRAVQYRTRAVGESPREEVRKIQDDIEAVQEKIELNSKSSQLLLKQTEYLDKLESFVAPTASIELSKGVLNAESLEQVTKFSFDQRKQILTEQVALSKESRDLQQQLDLLQRKMNEVTSGAKKEIREAVLFLQKHVADPQPIRLNYLVGNCGWSPSYTIRAEGDRASCKFEYNGLIYQMSGEGWQDVVLTLSTASPALSAAGPGLAPFRVSLTPNGQQQALLDHVNAPEQSQEQLKSILIEQKLALAANRNATNFDDNTRTSWGLNDAVNKFAWVEITGDYSLINTMQAEVSAMTQEPSLSYKLAAPVNLASRNSQQMVRILQTDLKSQFYHVATPVLANYVYREAELANDSQEDFLAGPITVYLDDRFVGRGEIPTVARGQTFVVGFGADSQLRARRELVEKTDGVNGGNRELKFEYRLVIENYKEAPASIRVIDRLPTARDDSSIRVTLNMTEEELSKDKLYNRQERPEGILRWDIVVEPRSVGEEARIITYGFTVEYDRNFAVSIPGSTVELQQDFERLQRVRTKR